MKKKILLIAIALLFVFVLVSAEDSPPSYLAVNMTFGLITSQPSYLAVNLTFIDDDVGPSAAADSCTPPASGNWEIICSDNCTLDTAATILGNISVSGGTGRFVVNVDLTYGTYIAIAGDCSVNKLDGVVIS